MTLARQIQNDLQARLAAGEPLPYPLTLAGIARHFGSSLMPVRTAVNTLLGRRFLLRQDNGHLAPNPRRRPAAASQKKQTLRPPSTPTLNPPDPDRAITDHVIALSLRGQESFLREEAAARRFGIGRTVVRRIFSRLSGSGMLEHVPRRGWRVRPFRERDMLDYLDIRLALELRALELAFPHLEPSVLERLLAANAPDRAGAAHLDNALHDYLVARSGNRYIQEFFAQHRAYYATLFDRAALASPVVAAMAAEHRAILQALLAQDLPRARAALTHHIQSQRPNVLHLLENLPREPATLRDATVRERKGNRDRQGAAALRPQSKGPQEQEPSV